MRSLLICLAILAPFLKKTVASDSAASTAPALLPANPAKAPILFEVRVISARPEFFERMERDTGPRQVRPMDVLSLPKVDDSEIEVSGGIRLLDARTVHETRPVIFLKKVANENLRDLIADAQSDTRSNIYFAPRLTVDDGQTVELYSSQTGGSKDVIAAGPNGDFTSRHPIGDAVRLMIRPQMRPEQLLRLDFRIRKTSLGNDEERPVDVASGQIPIQHVISTDIAASAILNSNESIAIWGFDWQHDQSPTREKPSTIDLIAASFGADSEPKPPMQFLLLVTPRAVTPPPPSGDR